MGSINLKHDDSGSDITLSSDGTSLLLDGSAVGGGGGADLYAANESSPSAQPSATGANAIAIGDSAVASGADGISIGKLSKVTQTRNSAVGEGAWATQSEAAAFGYNARATSNYSLALGARSASSSTATVALSFESSATAYGSVAIGISSKSTADRSVAFSNCRASGAHSFAAAIANNTTSYGASGANSIAMGEQAKSTGSNASALGGQDNIASGSRAVTIGGHNNTADGYYSSAKGYYGNTNGLRLKHVTGLDANKQGAYFVLGYNTTDATPIALNSSVWTPSATNQITLPNNSAYTFSGTIVAREKASEGTDVGAWEIKGIIRREANAGTTVLVNSVINELNVPTGWAVALAADTTNGCLKVEVTGVASTNIRWVATINTAEVTYA